MFSLSQSHNIGTKNIEETLSEEDMARIKQKYTPYLNSTCSMLILILSSQIYKYEPFNTYDNSDSVDSSQEQPVFNGLIHKFHELPLLTELHSKLDSETDPLTIMIYESI